MAIYLSPNSPTDSAEEANIEIGIAEVFHRREGTRPEESLLRGNTPHLSESDSELFMEVFWDLFRQGILTLGYDRSNREFPFCRLSRFGKQILNNQQVYFFHDVSTYEVQIKAQIPAIDETTLLYLKEAMQAFRSGCMLSATVMLGVAAESAFLTLLETIEANPKHQTRFASVQKERSILPKFNKFRAILEKHLADLPGDVKEDLDTQFTGIQSLIRTFRNESGHPTGQLVEREQVYVLLSLFIPYGKKLYQLIDWFAKP